MKSKSKANETKIINERNNRLKETKDQTWNLIKQLRNKWKPIVNLKEQLERATHKPSKQRNGIKRELPRNWMKETKRNSGYLPQMDLLGTVSGNTRYVFYFLELQLIYKWRCFLLFRKSTSLHCVFTPIRPENGHYGWLDSVVSYWIDRN